MRLYFYGLCVASALSYGCSSSSPQPSSGLVFPDESTKSASEGAAPANTAFTDAQMKSSSVTTLSFMSQQQRNIHLEALHMPWNLVTNAMSQRPCSVNIMSKALKQTRRLSYDASGRLIKQDIKTFRRLPGLSGLPSSTTSSTAIVYNDFNLLQSIDDGLFKTMYMYKGDVLEKIIKEPVKPRLGLTKTSSVFSHEESARTINASTMGGFTVESGASTETYVFDEQGRMISERSRAGGTWAYSVLPDKTQQIEHMYGSSKTIHTLKDGQLQRSMKVIPPLEQAPPKASLVRTYIYKDGKVVLATTTNMITKKITETIKYMHTCS